METFLLNLLKTSLLGSLAVLAMLALKPLWRERYRAKTRCWLWLALALFLLFPIDFSLENAPVQAAPPKDYTVLVGTEKTTVMATDNLFGDMAESSGQTPTEVRDAVNARPVTNPAQKTTRYIPVTAILFGGYLAGAAAFLLYQGGCYLHFRRTVRRWKRDVSRADYAFLLSDTARELQVSAPEMIVCEAVTTPAVTGLFRPRLLLPHERYDVQELRYILRHELCHLKRRDMLFKLVLLAANAMHWFNPVVYLMLRQADEDIELACDSAATDGLTTPERAAYSRTLLAAVQSNVRALPATTCFGGTVERLKRRITNVLGAQKKRGLGVVALVLALTLAAGCATTWGEGSQNSSPFDGSRYEASFIAENTGITIGENCYFFRSLSGLYCQLSQAEDGGDTVTLLYGSESLSFSPMEPVTLTDENFDTTYFPDMAALRSDNKAAWRAQLPDDFDDRDPEAAPNLIFLLKQNDGSLYLCIGYHFDSGDVYIKGAENMRWIYRLDREDDTFYSTIVLYSEKVLSDLRSGTMTYYVEGTGAVEDTVADARMTYFNKMSELTGLSPDGTVLELWHFNYECKPTNKAGAQITVVGGQELTDDGYLNENWTHYLTVLHYADGDETGYQILGTSMSNDGLFYNGCSYGEELKYYLHDFYIDYAGLDLPRYQIGALYHFTDGYGNDLTADGRVQSGDGWYFYLPNTGAWNASLEEPLWESAYGTKSTFVVKTFSTDASDAADYFKRDGWNVEDVDGQSVYTKTNGDQHASIRLYDRTDGGHYEVQTFWYDGQSTQENQWGWSAARQTAGERDLLEQMVKTFAVSDAMRKTYTPSFSADTELASNGGAAWMYLSKGNTEIGDRDMKDVTPTVRLEACDYTARLQYDPPSGGKVLELWLSNNDASHFAFYEGSNVMLYQCDEVRYYDVSNYGDYATLYDAMLAWYNSAERPDTGTSAIASATVTRDSIIKTAGSYVDYGGYLWYTAGGKFCRWHEGGSVETLRELPYNDVTDQPAIATLAVEYDQVALRWHIGGATTGTTMLELYGADGKRTMELDGSAPFAISGNTIVKLRSFPPTTGNLLLSTDGGKTWSGLGDADWFYGSVTEDSSGSTSYALADLTIRDGYVYTTAVYDIDHQKTSDPLVTRSVRVNLTTGALEILD